MHQNLTEKIIQQFAIEGDREIHSGDFVYIAPKFVMTHDNTAAVIRKFNSIGCEIFNSRQIVFTLDHDIQNKSKENIDKYSMIENFAATNNISFYPAGRGIGHQVMCEEGYITPHTLVVASDSHSNMYGGLSCLGTPVTRTDAAAIWATGRTWWQVPPVALVELTGKLQKGVVGKDIILALCGAFSNDEVLNHAVEFCGDAIDELSIDERLTIANMTTEWGALSGLFPFDDVLIHWFKEKNIKMPESEKLFSDAGAEYDKILKLDVSYIGPNIAGPNSVNKVTPVSKLRNNKVFIDKAYLLSCVNSRVSDIAEAAEILKGKKIASNVKFYLAAASDKIQAECERLGYWQSLIEAGAIVLPPGCGPCIGLGAGIVEDNEVAISATNRNFGGRMGSKHAEVYLASPAVVAFSALMGYIDFKGQWEENMIVSLKENNLSKVSQTGIIEGFPKEILGAAVFCTHDNINTDAIYPGKYTYDESITPSMQAGLAMENYSEEFQELTKNVDILIGGFNFGTGSSREQAATCFKHKQIKLLIAGSFSATYKRNAINNGLIVIESPKLITSLQQTYQNEKCVRLTSNFLINFERFTIEYDSQVFSFHPLGMVAQEIIASNGLVPWIISKKHV